MDEYPQRRPNRLSGRDYSASGAYFVTICTHEKRSLLSRAVGYLKMNSSKRIRASRPGLAVWQRSFHDHIIRGEADHREIWAYIDGNPAKWAEDRFYPDAR